MKKVILSVCALLASMTANAGVTDELTGDTRTACEVILCLSSGSRPKECRPPIAKYFSILAYKHGVVHWGRTITKRKNFLELCPMSSDYDTDKLSSLKDNISELSTGCDAAALNKLTDKRRTGYEDEVEYRTTAQLPQYCDNLFNHSYTDYKGSKPKYICNKQWYRSEDFNRGYKESYIEGRMYPKRITIKKDCWVDMPASVGDKTPEQIYREIKKDVESKTPEQIKKEYLSNAANNKAYERYKKAAQDKTPEQIQSEHDALKQSSSTNETYNKYKKQFQVKQQAQEKAKAATSSHKNQLDNSNTLD